ncbi:phosphoenolpyruvate synthase, partial [Candidatus Falkowbacteria bacterium]|nr:phosphoenolpyruvate synthase [Candidatus Falkowbacteria bacterium]
MDTFKRKIARPHILWFKSVDNDDVGAVGGKNASLGEMYSKLTKKGIKIPNGFCVTAYAYEDFIKSAGIDDDIQRVLKDLNTHDVRELKRCGEKARGLILRASLPKLLEADIRRAYGVLVGPSTPPRQARGRSGSPLTRQWRVHSDGVAVRSSATAEDLPDASFAGQQETYLNVRGEKALLDSVKKCFASLFTNRAISYRQDKGFKHDKVLLSVGVQEMVRADKGVSGVMFTIDTESGFRDLVLINAIYGLGENIVQGKVTPDEYYVYKPKLREGFEPIVLKRLGKKNIKMIYSNTRMGKPVKNVPVTESERDKYALSDKEILTLAKWGLVIEEHYKRPMDIEWAKDGLTDELYIVQARPETVHSTRDLNTLEEFRVTEDRGGLKKKILVEGKSVGNRIGVGPVRVIRDVGGINGFKKGEVLVTEMTNPDWEPIMKIAAGIVTNSGGRTCHAAIVSRELRIPCIVGTEKGTSVLRDKQEVTVDCSGGEVGYVYKGKIDFAIRKYDFKNLGTPKTKIMMNVGNPEEAFRESFIPNSGVGLAREEFIISSYIGVHPMALIEFNKVKDKETREKILKKTGEYKTKKDFYIFELAEGIAQIASAYYPKEVIVRLSDFKTNEYATLLGGKYFEPEEANPMLGWRGAARYYDPKFRPAFELECAALVRVREKMGLTNVKIMVPFCRTVEEGKKVLKIMEECGLKRGVDGLEVYVMCEIPSNVILAREFAKIFDGFSIGTNDLTQLVLGVDRDSEIVAHV